jgi:hypothetical protein
MMGHCFCGFIRYRADGVRSNETNCHCSICRRVSAAPFVAWFTVPSSSFQVLSGQPTTFRSSDHGTRTFCPRCGTPLTFRSSLLPDEVDITICSLDDPEQVPPKDHTRVSSRLSWVRLDDQLPVFAEDRSP